MKFFLIALPLCVLGVSCERHDFEETKSLHEKHGAAHEEHAAAGHPETHGEPEKAEHGAH